MKNEFLIAMTQLAGDKNLPKEVVFEAVEAALASAYRKDNLASANVVVRIDRETGAVRVFTQRTVTEELSDERTEISLEEARRYRPDAQFDDVIEFEAAPQHGGRIAAQTAKQVVLQRVREAEREVVFEEYSGKSGDVVSGVVQRLEGRNVVVDMGRTEAILPPTEQVRPEHYRPGQRLKLYLLEVYKATKGPQVVVSRSHRNLLRRLFELEVPEIFRGTVEIKSIAREPGYRSKVAVTAHQEGVDPVGACVGLRGIRIQNIVNELNGERIDVVQWDSEPARFVANALSPAQVLSVLTKPEENTAEVVVPDRQLSLAIGKEGQNARLAAKLTGWRIDIKSQSAHEQDLEAKGLSPEAVVAAQAPTVEVQPEAAAAPSAPEIGAPAEEAPERPLAPEEEAVLAFQKGAEAAPEGAPQEAAPVESAPAEPPASRRSCWPRRPLKSRGSARPRRAPLAKRPAMTSACSQSRRRPDARAVSSRRKKRSTRT
jgi:N utilization substance protein A